MQKTCSKCGSIFTAMSSEKFCFECRFRPHAEKPTPIDPKQAKNNAVKEKVNSTKTIIQGALDAVENGAFKGDKKVEALNLYRDISEVVSTYRETGDIEKTARQLGYSYGTIRKMLSTVGVFISDQHRTINEMYGSGISQQIIADMFGMTKKQLNSYLPYTRKPLIRWDSGQDVPRSQNAQTIQKHRKNRADLIPLREYAKLYELNPSAVYVYLKRKKIKTAVNFAGHWYINKNEDLKVRHREKSGNALESNQDDETTPP